LSDVLNGSVSNNSYELYQEFKKVSNSILDMSDPNGFPVNGFSINPRDWDGNESYIISLIDRYNILKNILGVKNDSIN
jgi:hypothetical protein